MSVWSQLGDFLSGVMADTVATVIEAVRTTFEGDPETRKRVGFSVAIIALSAKIAKADGFVSDEEVAAFQEIFEIPEKEFKNVSRLYNLARQDVAGFEFYARQVKSLFPEEEAILHDVLDGLFHIAKADGIFHEKEREFVDAVAAIFGIEGREYERIKVRHLEPDGGNPYIILEASADWTDDELKKHHRKLVRENHPDTLIARGVPAEFIAIANHRLAEINSAWESIRLERSI